jgi:hypothetical protein
MEEDIEFLKKIVNIQDDYPPTNPWHEVVPLHHVLRILEKREIEKDVFAISFANWVSELSASQKVSVWSKNGEHSGLFTMDNEQLLDKYKGRISHM